MCLWEDAMSDFWHGKHVCVTGGAGFLGKHVVAELTRRECQNIFVPRSEDFDLTPEAGLGRDAAMSCLFGPPDAEVDPSEAPREGMDESAGFVAMRFVAG